MSPRATVWPPHAGIIGAASPQNCGPLPPVCPPPGNHGRKPASPLALLLSDPTRRPGPHPSAHLSGSQIPPESSHECSSQQAQAVLKFHMGWSCGSVQQSFCGAEPPQKLFFDRNNPGYSRSSGLCSCRMSRAMTWV